MGLLTDDFAYSYSHGIVRVNQRQFTDISAVSINQELTESAVYGTDARPLKRSVGQLGLGRGQLTFSDMGEAVEFFVSLGNQPLMTIFQLSYQLAKPSGDLVSIDCASCRLTSIGIEHSAGGEALGMSFPFSFLQVRINGIDSFLSPQALFNIGQNLVNLL